MVKPTFKPLTPKHYRRSCFGGYIRKDNIPSKLTPQGAITFHEFVKARGGTPYRLDTGGDGIFDPFQEYGKNSKSPSKK